MIHSSLKYFAIAALLISGLFLYSCNKENPESFVHVRVEDKSGNPITGADVRLYGEPSDTVYVNSLSLYDLNATTDDSGLAIFRFTDFYDQGSTGFAVLRIEVSKDTLSGESFVTIREDETVEQTVRVD